MKLEDLKNSYIIPEKPQIDIKSIYIEPKKEKFKFRRMSLQLGLSFAFLLFLGVALFLRPSNKRIIPPVIKTPVVLKGAELDHFSAVSCSLLLTEVDKHILMSGEVPSTLFEEKIDFINPYINVFEVFVGTNKPVIRPQTEGILEGYTHYDQIVFTDSFGNESVYHFHYIVEEEVDDDEEILKEGVIIHNGEKTYMEIEIESESDEIEKEYLIYSDISRKDKDYVKLEIEKDLETGEQTYKYSVYNDGDEINKVIVELEEDDGDVELNLEVEIKDILKFKLELYKVENIFKGTYEIDNDDDEKGFVEIKIVKENNTYYYEYKVSNKLIRRVRSY